jgi:hypothetical protein
VDEPRIRFGTGLEALWQQKKRKIYDGKYNEAII